MNRIDRGRRRRIAWFAAVLVAVAGSVSSPARADDPPTRVGRIALIENGAVSIRPAPDGNWAEAIPNYPLGQSAAVWTDQGARAELEIGEARVRLSEGTELDIVQLDDNNVVLSVPRGRVDVALHNRWQDERYIVRVPAGETELLDDGNYRLVSGQGGEPGRVGVFDGAARVTGPAGQTPLRPGEELVADPADLSRISVGQVQPDDFDGWSHERDRSLVARPAPSYVPPVPGATALDDYGTWRDVPDYGHVWIPADVPANWAPYRFGHWASIAPWGWTWIDDSPWGFAPFHYGRWAMIGNAWGWVPVEPGVVIEPRVRSYYAPALVSFVGDPGALGVGVAIGAVGWVALGPREPWHPWYHCSDDYVRRVNRVEVDRFREVDTQRTFVNQRFATVVPRQDFAAGRPIERAALRVPPQALARPLPMAPRRDASFLPPAPAHPVTPGFVAQPGARQFRAGPPGTFPARTGEVRPATPVQPAAMAAPGAIGRTPLDPRLTPNRPTTPANLPVADPRRFPQPQPQPRQPSPPVRPQPPAAPAVSPAAVRAPEPRELRSQPAIVAQPTAPPRPQPWQQERRGPPPGFERPPTAAPAAVPAPQANRPPPQAYHPPPQASRPQSPAPSRQPQGDPRHDPKDPRHPDDH